MQSLATLLIVATFALPAETPAAAASADATASIAEIDAALTAWDGSCKKGAHGLCVQVTPPAAKAPAGRCAPRRLGAIDVRSRGKRGEVAREKLAAAVAKAEALPDPSDAGDKAALAAALAQGKIALLDQDMEAFLALTMPTDLDFFVEEWKKDSGNPKWEAQYERQVAKKEASMKKFKAFFDAKTKLGTALTKDLAGLKKFGEGHVVIEAALKTAWLSQNMADELSAAPIPKSLAKAEVKEAYCDALEGQAEGPEKTAKDALVYCTNKALETKVTGDAVDACRDLLGRYPKDGSEAAPE